MDAQHTAPAPIYAQYEQPPARQGGLLIVPRGRPAPMPQATAQSAQAVEEGPVFPVVIQARSMYEGRAAARAQAIREAAAQGVRGAPSLRGESFGDGFYNGFFEFPAIGGAAGGFPGMQQPPATVPESAPEATPQRMARPGWILVLPVEGGRDGRSVWGRATTWTRAWLAPVRQSGMRIVSTAGDADDRDRLTERALADPSDPRIREGALAIARKYGAPAVALVRLDTARGNAVRISLWRGGDTFTGDGFPAASPEAARAGALQLLSDLAHGQGREGGDMDFAGYERRAAQPADAPPSSPPVRLAVFRTGPDGSIFFVIRQEGGGDDVAEAARSAMRDVRGTSLRTVRPDGDGLTFTGTWHGAPDQASFERALVAAGLRLIR